MADLVAAGVMDLDPGQPAVPVSVWRATSLPELPAAPWTPENGLTPALAARLLALYTDPHDTVVDTTSDPALAGAAGAGGRRYLDLPRLLAGHHRQLSGQVALILLRWPPAGAPLTSTPVTAHDPVPQLAACAALLGPEGHTVVILTAPAGHYRDHAATLIPAARRAGLGYLQHVVAITTPITATIPEPGDPAPFGSDIARPQAHLDLLVFILRHCGEIPAD